MTRAPGPAPGPTVDAARAKARYRRILRFAMRYLVQTWWYELVLPKVGLARWSARGRPARMRAIARHFHRLAVELGGLMIKVGQFMSSRLDVLPPEITSELAGLQDEVPPAPFEPIRELAQAELGMPLEAAYPAFSPNPVAAASLGQAHQARLAPAEASEVGFEHVIVKVQRPGIQSIVEVDLAALRRVAGWVSRFRAVADRVDANALVREFATTSLQEIDYLHEAAAAERFGEMFADDPRVAVPSVVWERTTRRMLTLSDVTAIKINDVDALRAAGIDPAEVAAVFARTMFAQVFEHGYFHADPHPGNIFVTPRPAGPGDRRAPEWALTFIDFGMMGEITDELRAGLRRVLLAVAARDGRGLVRAIQEIGMLLPNADTAELERAMSQLFDRFGGMGFAQLRKVDEREFRDFGREFGEVVRALPFQLPENFLLVIRAMSLTSGVCSSLDPDFNIWDEIEPYAGRLLRDESGNAVLEFARQALALGANLLRLPPRIDALITRVNEGSVTVAAAGVDRRLRRIERLVRAGVGSLLFAGLLMGGILALPTAAPLGIVLICVSVLPLGYAIATGAQR